MPGPSPQSPNPANPHSSNHPRAQRPDLINATEQDRGVARLLRLLDAQLDALFQLDSLSVMQSAAASQGDVERVLALLAERQPLVDTLATLSSDLSVFVDGGTAPAHGQAIIASVPPLQRAHVESRLKQINTYLDAISQRDFADRAALIDSRNTAARELASLAQHRGATAAYAGDALGARAATPPSPMFQDQRA